MYGAWGLGFRVRGSGFRGWGCRGGRIELKFRVQGSGLRVQGPGLKFSGLGSVVAEGGTSS